MAAGKDMHATVIDCRIIESQPARNQAWTVERPEVEIVWKLKCAL